MFNFLKKDLFIFYKTAGVRLSSEHCSVFVRLLICKIVSLLVCLESKALTFSEREIYFQFVGHLLGQLWRMCKLDSGHCSGCPGYHATLSIALHYRASIEPVSKSRLVSTVLVKFES